MGIVYFAGMDLRKPLKKAQSPQGLLAVVAVVSVLPFLLVELFPAHLKVAMSPAPYALFHNLTELFSIMVALSIFGIGWFTHDQTKNRYTLFVSAAFLAIALLDLMHTLSIASMPDFLTPNSSNKASQFWIAARFATAAGFLGSAYVYPKSKGAWLTKPTLLCMVGCATAAAFAGIIFFPEAMPATFIAGYGVTPFKKIAEYLIILVFALALAAYWTRFRATGEKQVVNFMAAFVISIYSELVLAQYTQAFDTYNILGHLYKTAAFCLIYVGVFTTSIRAPYARLVAARALLRQEVAERLQVENEVRMHRDHLEEMVAQRTRQLEETNKELESFSYSVSHDLRAPLRAIDGYSRMLMKDHANRFDEEARRKFEVIRESVRAMAQLIDDLLAFSRLGRQTMTMEDIDMEGLFAEVWEELRATDLTRQITLTSGGLPPARGDRALIKQVVANLLSNSIKFTATRDPALIEAKGQQKDHEIVYTIKDNGVGFDMRFSHKLFGVFQRLHSGGEFEGTGVGLAIVQRIINRHGGRVWAEGEVDRGAAFHFTLPLKETD